MIVLVALIARRGANWNPYRLILTGVMVSAGLNALISLILVLSPPNMMKGIDFLDDGGSHPRATSRLGWCARALNYRGRHRFWTST